MCASRTTSLIITALISSASVPLLAQSANTENRSDKPAGVKPVADYKKAVALLMKLGVPSMKGAKYGKINANSNSYYGSEKEAIKGNAWVFMDENGKPNQAMHNFEPAKPYKPNGARYTPGELAGKLTEVDLKKDIALCLKQLSDAQFVKKQKSRMSYSQSLFPKYFMFGCLAYASGNKEGGKQVIEKVISIVDVELLLDQIVSKYAMSDYTKVYKSFKRSGNWKAYKRGVDKLIVKYSRGWPTQKALVVLSKKLQQRISNQKFEIRSPKGLTLNTKVVSLLKGVVSGKEDQAVPYNCWLITEKVRQRYSGISDGNSNTSIKLASYKMDTFIAMASLLENDYMVVSKNRDDYGNYYSSFSSNEFDVDRLYASLEKPKSMGDYAESWVRAAAPHLDKGRSLSRSELRVAAINWWKSSKDLSKIKLLKEISKGLESYKKSELMRGLISSKDAEVREFFEKTILDDPTPYQYIRLVEEYASTHKLQVSDFAVKFVKKINNSQDPQLVSMRADKRQNEYLQSSIADIESHTETIDVEKVFKELSGKNVALSVVTKNMKRLSNSLGVEMLENETRAKLVIQAAKFDDEKAGKILDVLLKQFSKLGLREKLPEAKSPIIISALEKAAWKNLLEKKGKGSGMYQYYLKSMAGQSALVLEAIANRKNINLRGLHSVVGSDGAEKLLLERAQNTIDGKANEPFPSAELVSASDMKKLLHEFSKTDIKDLKKLIDKWSISQQLAFAQNREKGEAVDKIIKKAKSYIYILDDSAMVGDGVFRKDLKQFVTKEILGRESSGSMMKKLLIYCYKNAKDSDGIMLSIAPAPSGVGRQLYLASLSEKRISGSIKYYFADAEKDLVSGKLTKYVGVTVIGRSSKNISYHWKDIATLNAGWESFEKELNELGEAVRNNSYNMFVVDSKKAMDARAAAELAERKKEEKELLKVDASSGSNKEVIDNLTEKQKAMLKKALEESGNDFSF